MCLDFCCCENVSFLKFDWGKCLPEWTTVNETGHWQVTKSKVRLGTMWPEVTLNNLGHGCPHGYVDVCQHAGAVAPMACPWTGTPDRDWCAYGSVSEPMPIICQCVWVASNEYSCAHGFWAMHVSVASVCQWINDGMCACISVASMLCLQM